MPPSDEFLEQLIAEDQQRRRRRQLSWLAGIVLLLGTLVGAGWFSYEWTQDQYFVAEHEGYVAIYQGVQQNLGPIELHQVVEQTDISVASLPLYQHSQVQQTISATSLEDAREIVERLRSVTAD